MDGVVNVLVAVPPVRTLPPVEAAYQSMVWPVPGVAPIETVPVPQRLPVETVEGAVGYASTVNVKSGASEMASMKSCLNEPLHGSVKTEFSAAIVQEFCPTQAACTTESEVEA